MACSDNIVIQPINISILNFNLDNINVSSKYKNMYGAIGIHPEDVDSYSLDDIKFIENNISNKKISTNLIFTAFLLGFGGISVLLQVFSITSKSDLSIKPYVYGKLLHGVLAAFYTYIFTSFIPFFNFDL